MNLADPDRNPESTVAAAMLLSFVGGFLDVFTYTGHGGVFANAQTGNVILLGAALAEGAWARALQHIPAILAFLFGIFSVHLLQRAAARRGWRSTFLALLIETALILTIGLLPNHTPDFWVVIAVAFAASLQFAGFPTVGGWAYTSVVTTGNLRRLVAAVFSALIGKDDPLAAQRARAFGLVFLAFVGGAVIGSLATRRLHNLAALLPAACLFAMLVRSSLINRREKRGPG